MQFANATPSLDDLSQIGAGNFRAPNEIFEKHKESKLMHRAFLRFL